MSWTPAGLLPRLFLARFASDSPLCAASPLLSQHSTPGESERKREKENSPSSSQAPPPASASKSRASSSLSISSSSARGSTQKTPGASSKKSAERVYVHPNAERSPDWRVRETVRAKKRQKGTKMRKRGRRTARWRVGREATRSGKRSRTGLVTEEGGEGDGRSDVGQRRLVKAQIVREAMRVSLRPENKRKFRQDAESETKRVRQR
ncbi:UNVERIFIED_CONTAM: hypothetical protein HHA_314760 [Hammondia hammondi]|eukprot:XP_008885016.1 hypothetical protein HHA_314760 [Hammondia hammondi]